MKKINNVLIVTTLIISVVALIGCVVLSAVCINTNNKLKSTNDKISKYSSDPFFFRKENRYYSLHEIINQHEQQIEQLRYNQSNFQRDLSRSNKFLEDYNSSRFFDDSWPMKQQY